MKVYYERTTDDFGDLFWSEMKIYRDDKGQFWLEGSGGAGSIFAKPDGPGSTRSGSKKHRIGKGYWDLSLVNEAYRLGLELPDEFIDDGLKNLRKDWIEAGLPVGFPLA